MFVAKAQGATRGLRYDPDGEVLVTVGASEGIAAAVLGAAPSSLASRELAKRSIWVP